jgi:3-isopropylmalate/(R)-2-methylmalate dehydratase small subunit
MIVTGRVWKFGDNINTDLIQPIEAILKPVAEQPAYAFSATRPGWSALVRPGDIIVGGRNFGTGSGRPAARVLLQLGIAAIVADSLPGLFFRNCVNYGMPAVQCPGFHDAVDEGDVIEIDLRAARVTNTRTGQHLDGRQIPEQLYGLMSSGGVFRLLEREGFLEPDELAGSSAGGLSPAASVAAAVTVSFDPKSRSAHKG